MKKLTTILLSLIFLISMVSFVLAYTGNDVASEFKNGGLYGTPFPFNDNNEEVKEFIAADSNGDGVVTGQEICVAHGMQCAYTQRTAYNVNSNQGNIAELAGPTIGCFGGDNYENTQSDNLVKCFKDGDLAKIFTDGSMISSPFPFALTIKSFSL